MSLLRTTRLLRPLAPRFIATPAQHRLAHQDYGSGAGNPVGENPQDQGKNPSEDKEHPGPPPPSTGKSQGGGQQQQPSEQQPSKDQGGSNTKGAQPKILSASPPQEHEASEDVQRHNKEMDQRADKAAEKANNEDAEKDKVGKGFWSGKLGLYRSHI